MTRMEDVLIKIYFIKAAAISFIVAVIVSLLWVYNPVWVTEAELAIVWFATAIIPITYIIGEQIWERFSKKGSSRSL